MGGKWLLAPWIIAHFPAHRLYVEPFGGAASVLLRKPKVSAEVWNDLNSEVVTLFRVLRDPAQSCALLDALRLTPFSRAEFEGSYETSPDPVEMARRLIVRSFQGFIGAGVSYHTGFRVGSNRSGTSPARDWKNYPDCLPFAIDRLRGVAIESKDALAVMRQGDGPDTLHYVDPPYWPETRSQKVGPRGQYHSYVHELTPERHADLLDFLKGLKGMVVLSGYPCALYDDALASWTRVERQAMADGARPRTEILWINPKAAEALGDRRTVHPSLLAAE